LVTRMMLLWVLLLPALAQSDFKRDQRRYPRYRAAVEEKQAALIDRFERLGIAYPPTHVLLVAYKQERQLELWLRSQPEQKMILFETYAFCESSGVLGPKRRQGDLQIPEGYYWVDRFNPASNFWLSLGINYPNRSDRILGTAKDLGGDIFIHGACVTIGCIPITDDKIKELYLLAVEARHAGQARIPVYIFPARLETENLEKLIAAHPMHRALWQNLAEGYRRFQATRQPLEYRIDEQGRYQLREP